MNGCNRARSGFIRCACGDCLFIYFSGTCKCTRVLFRARRDFVAGRSFPEEIARNTEHTALYSQHYPDVSEIVSKDLVAWRTLRACDRWLRPRQRPPRPTMTHRVASVWYIRDARCCTMLLSFFHFSYPFVRPYLFICLAVFIPLLLLSLSFFLSFLFFKVSLTCAAVETSTASCRCQRCARSSPATACARIEADPVARWTAACFSRAGGRTRGRLFARGRPC